jgi:hypothetical protein
MGKVARDTISIIIVRFAIIAIAAIIPNPAETPNRVLLELIANMSQTKVIDDINM